MLANIQVQLLSYTTLHSVSIFPLCSEAGNLSSSYPFLICKKQAILPSYNAVGVCMEPGGLDQFNEYALV